MCLYKECSILFDQASGGTRKINRPKSGPARAMGTAVIQNKPPL